MSNSLFYNFGVVFWSFYVFEVVLVRNPTYQNTPPNPTLWLVYHNGDLPMSRRPLDLPRPDTLGREFVDFVNREISRSGSRTVTMVPFVNNLVEKNKSAAFRRVLLSVARDYRWFVRSVRLGDLAYEFGDWCQVDENEHGKTFYFPDPRYVTIPKEAGKNPGSTRKFKFRGEPPRGSKIGTVYRFLLNNRSPGTGVVNVQSLYEMEGFGAKAVARHFNQLRLHYGFHIKNAGQPRNFIVTKEPNVRKF